MKIFALLAAVALAQGAPPPPEAPAPETVKVTLTTSQGPVVLELEKGRAPLTTANFLRYVDQKRLDGAAFYRAAKAPNVPDYGLVQFGTRNDPKRTLPPVAHEPTSQTGLSHRSGTISLARGAPGTGAGDFFILVGDTPSLDAQPGGDPGFAAFGHVVEGMDLVKTILAAPTDPNKGEGVMKGQYLAQPVVIVTARRTN
ncbi:peptidylprolyl isomerase [Sphingomonas sp. ID1715]|uniref:peptidylprolyl isomerase n=1 Tax=Sphingomonas sp. ID1715 TaxID=1656898 RepID=UPI00148882E0|nr:peptidylprolyl isomerase [Sphingomonas sp. ID1715]NNM77635.1 peptidylprolyl isomerase [Sphingomonas sp. ID1715]